MGRSFKTITLASRPVKVHVHLSSRPLILTFCVFVCVDLSRCRYSPQPLYSLSLLAGGTFLRELSYTDPSQTLHIESNHSTHSKYWNSIIVAPNTTKRHEESERVGIRHPRNSCNQVLRSQPLVKPEVAWGGEYKLALWWRHLATTIESDAEFLCVLLGLDHWPTRTSMLSGLLEPVNQCRGITQAARWSQIHVRWESGTWNNCPKQVRSNIGC